MSARFRIRTPQGQELSFATHEMFAEFVRSGDLSPDDVVYDAQSKEWASARTHPVVLQLEIEAEERAEEAAKEEAFESAADGTAVEAPAASAVPDLGLELAPAPEEPSGEEATRAFVAKMEAERAAELDFDEKLATEDFTIKQGDGFVEQLTRPDPAPTPPRPRPRKEPLTAPQPRKRAKKKKKGAGAGRYAPFAIVIVVVVGVGVYFGTDLITPTTAETTETTTGPDVVPDPPPPPPLIPDTEEALRERAQERFLNRTRALLRALEPIPETWLSGRYLASPSEYPEVRTVWASYLTTIREVRGGDEGRYRAGYETALDDARVQGEARSLRLARAMQSFSSTLEARVAHYDRVEAMASAAIQGHDALLDAEGTIAYEPGIGGRGVSEGPGAEAVGRGPQAQALLDDVLEVVLGRLHGNGGPGEIANVREWVYDGLLDAVTR